MLLWGRDGLRPHSKIENSGSFRSLGEKMAAKKSKKKTSIKNNSNGKDKNWPAYTWTDSAGRIHESGSPPEVTNIYLLSGKLNRIAQYIADRTPVTAERIQEHNFTDDELLSDLKRIFVMCNEAIEVGRQLMTEWPGKVHDTIEDAIVVVAVAQQHLYYAQFAIEDIVAAEKMPEKEKIQTWTDEFNKSKGLQKEFSKDGLKAYVAFKKKSLGELPPKHSARAYDRASGCCEKLQELGKRLTVRFAEHWEKTNQAGPKEDNKEIRQSQSLRLNQMPMGVPFNLSGEKVIRTPMGIEVIKSDSPGNVIWLDLSNRSNDKYKRLLIDIIQDGERRGVSYDKPKALERLKEWFNKSIDMAEDVKVKKDFETVAKSLEDDKKNRKVKTTIPCGGVFIHKV